MADNDFSTLFDLLPIGAYRSSPDGRQLRANPALARLDGYDTEAEEIRVARRPDRLAEPDDQHQGALQYESLRVRRARKTIEETFGGKAGEYQIGIDAERMRMPDESRLDRLREPLSHAEIAST